MAADTQEQLTLDGQEVQQGSYNNVAAQAAGADDRVWAELLRLAPYDGTHYARAVIPFGPMWGPALAQNGLIQPKNGGVQVMPFRAIIGSRAAIAAYTPPVGSPALVTGQNNPTATTNFRGIKSGLYVPTDDNATLGHFQALANNVSGNPRIDLVYAQMTVNANGGSIQRMVRPPVVNSAPAQQNVVLQLVQAITIQVVTGATTAGPPLPTLPADTPGSGIFNIPLAYVMVPGTFNSGISTLGAIQTVAPCVPFDGRATGAFRARPATCISTDTTQLGLPAWASGTPTPQVLPATMLGGECIFVNTSLTATTNVPADAAVVDGSIDWRGRFFLWFAQTGATVGGVPSWFPGYLSTTAPNGNAINAFAPSNLIGSGAAVNDNSAISFGFGQSFGVDDTAGQHGLAASPTRTGATVASLNSFQGLISPEKFGLYVDMTTGQLKAYNGMTYATQGTKNCFFWIFASAQIDNGLF